MLVVREVFTAKPGQASKLAAMLKDAVATRPSHEGPRAHRLRRRLQHRRARDRDRADMAHSRPRCRSTPTNSAMREKMRGYTELWHTGRREVYRVV